MDRKARYSQGEHIVSSIANSTSPMTKIIGVVGGILITAIPSILVSVMAEKRDNPNFDNSSFGEKTTSVRRNMTHRAGRLVKQKAQENMLDMAAGVVDTFFKRVNKRLSRGFTNNGIEVDIDPNHVVFRKFIEEEGKKHGVITSGSNISSQKEMTQVMDKLIDSYKKSPPIDFGKSESLDKVEVSEETIVKIMSKSSRKYSKDSSKENVFNARRMHQIKYSKMDPKEEEKLEKLREVAQKMREEGESFFS